MRPISNPPNPFLSAHAEYLDEPPPGVKLDVYEEQAKSVLSENDSPDVGFRWSVNPYRGCQHACSYCYARPTHEYLGLGAGTDFESKIFVKVNAPELLAAALARKSWQHETVVFSGVTDCYQPLEAVYELTQRCLKVCLDHRTPAGIITKSYLVCRDAELLAVLNRRVGARVHQSITFADEKVCRRVEPGAPTPSRRFDAMKRLADAGVPVGIMIGPLIPGLNDRDIPRLLERAADCGASSAAYVPLRLPGSVKEVFLPRLRAELPDRARRVELLIRGMRGGKLSDPRFHDRMRGDGVYWESVRQLFQKSAERFGLTGRDRGHGPSESPASAASQPAVAQLDLFR